MKDFVKTLVGVGATLLIIIVTFFGISFFTKISEIIKTESIALNDPMVSLNIDKLTMDDHLRIASFKSSELESDYIIKYIFSVLTEDDYKEKDYKKRNEDNKKSSIKASSYKNSKSIYENESLCSINSNISFYGYDDCMIRVISNQTIEKYENEIFGLKKELIYDEFEYNGLICKNDGKNYYCMKTPYLNYNRNYSILKKAYKIKKELFIEEYYLNVDLSDEESCSEFYGTDLCTDYRNHLDEFKELDEETIKDKATLYLHTLSINDDSYSLKKSEIIS